MKHVLLPSTLLALLMVIASPADRVQAQQTDPIRIGVNTAIQQQVGRDAIDSIKMAIDEINTQGGLLGRKLEMVVADEGEAASEGPKVGIAAVNKLTSEDHVDVLIGGYDSGVTLGELPHIARAKTIFLDIGSASPAITQKVKDDYDHYKYIFRVNPINSARQSQALINFITGKLRVSSVTPRFRSSARTPSGSRTWSRISRKARRPPASRCRSPSSSTCRPPTSRRSSPR